MIQLMSICDFCASLELGLEYFNDTNNLWSHELCILSGFWQIFWLDSSIFWNFILFISLFRVMYCNSTFEKISNEMNNNNICNLYIFSCFTISLILSLIPIKYYSFLYEDNHYD